MKITVEEARRIANLAHLDFTEAEMEVLARQLGDVLAYFEQLRELDTESVEPTSHVLDLTNAFRPDETRPSLSPDEATSGAPAREAGHFKVPKVL